MVARSVLAQAAAARPSLDDTLDHNSQCEDCPRCQMNEIHIETQALVNDYDYECDYDYDDSGTTKD